MCQSLERLSNQFGDKAAALLLLFLRRFVVGWIPLVYEARVLGVFDHDALAAKGVFKQLDSRAVHSSNAQLLAQDESLRDNELLLVDRHDQDVVLLPRVAALVDRLTNGHVLDLDLLGPRLELESRRFLFDDGSNVDLPDLLHLAVDDELFLAKLERLIFGDWAVGKRPSLELQVSRVGWDIGSVSRIRVGHQCTIGRATAGQAQDSVHAALTCGYARSVGTSRTVVVPVEPAGKVLIARAQIASGPEARLVVDTGAGTSALSRECASRLGLPIHRDLRVRTATGVGGVGTLAVRGLCVGP